MTRYLTAADLLRQALADAPDGLHVARDYHDQLAIFDADDVLADNTYERHQALMPLVGLLLAAAPHLAGLLNARARHCDEDDLTLEEYTLLALDGIDSLAAAITEAAQAMEAES